MIPQMWLRYPCDKDNKGSLQFNNTFIVRNEVRALKD